MPHSANAAALLDLNRAGAEINDVLSLLTTHLASVDLGNILNGCINKMVSGVGLQLHIRFTGVFASFT